jgi:hypothetical protein
MLGPPTASLFPAARHLSGLAIVVRNPSISRWHRHPDGGPAIHIFRCSIAETEQHLRSSQGGTCATHFWKLYSPNPPHIFENATIRKRDWRSSGRSFDHERIWIFPIIAWAVVRGR